MTKKVKYFIGCDLFDNYKPKNLEMIFALELLPQPSHSDALIAMKWAMHAKSKLEINSFPEMVKMIENPDIPNDTIYALHPSKRVERVKLEWDDKEKKNKVIVTKIKEDE
jgi:hypothetical protein